MEKKSKYSKKANANSRNYLQTNEEARLRKQKNNKKSLVKNFILKEADEQMLNDLSVLISNRLKDI